MKWPGTEASGAGGQPDARNSMWLDRHWGQAGGMQGQHTCTKARLDQSDHSSYFVHMREITAKEAKNRFGQLLRSAQQGPVRVTRNGTPVGVVLSVEQFERLRGTAWDRLAAAMDAMSHEAAASGLTPAALESLLSDES